MRLIIAGSRGVTDYAIVREAVIASGLWKQYAHQLEIVSGMARGVDLLGKEFALKNNLTLHEFPVTSEDWNKHGKKAGMLRNICMGEFSDALVAIWDGKSRGTKQMIDWATTHGLFVYVHTVEENK
jgi:hypothetical protein